MKDDSEQQQYDLMLLLENLESLREDMLEFGIESLQQLEQRISELHQRLDGLGDS